MTTTRRAGRKDERGAATVEAALIIITLTLVVFGILEYALAFKDALTLESATRAGARSASAYDKNSTSFFDSTAQAAGRAANAGKFRVGDTMQIYKANAAGDPASGCPGTWCRQFRFNGTTWTSVGGTNFGSNLYTCIGDTVTNKKLDAIGVRMQLTHRPVTGMFKTLNLRRQTVMQMEPSSQYPDCD